VDNPESQPAGTGLAKAIQAEIGRVIQGQAAALQSLLVALVAGGHVLLEGVPGVAKTLLANSLAATMKCSFSRIQFTPDLMPADITGVSVFEPQTGQFRFRRGPIFGDVVLADEINRSPAKTQAALLEAMQEQQVTVDGTTHPLSSSFMVIATQNPIEFEGTYPLAEAQLDRFLMKVMVPYPEEADERAMLKKVQELGDQAARPVAAIRPIATQENLLELRRRARSAKVDDAVIDYVLRLVRQSRSMPSLSLGASPRAAVMLLQSAKALATLRGRDYASPDDVRAVAAPVLRHRIRLTPEAEIQGLAPDACVHSLMTQVAVPR